MNKLSLFAILSLYIVAPNAIKLILLALLVLLVLKKAELGVIIFLISSIFDNYFTIPYLGRSILLLIIPICLIKILFLSRFNKKIFNAIPSFFLSGIFISYGVYQGYHSINEISGFDDPTRGIIFLISLFYIIILISQTDAERDLNEIRQYLPLVPIFFIISIPLSTFLYDNFLYEQRLQGSFGDPNYFSRYAILSLLITIYYFKNSILKTVLILLIITAIVLSASKTAVLTIIVMFLYYILTSSSFKYKIATTSFLAILILLFYLTGISDFVTHRFNSSASIYMNQTKVTNPIDIMTSGRSYLWDYFLTMFNPSYKHFYFGTGIGTSSSFFNDLIGKNIVAHNSFIEIMLDIGIIGFLLIVVMFTKILKLSKSNKISYERIFPYLIILFFIFDFTLSGFWVKQNIAILFMIIISYGKKSKDSYC